MELSLLTMYTTANKVKIYKVNHNVDFIEYLIAITNSILAESRACFY